MFLPALGLRNDMRILDRYIARNIATHTAIVLLVLLALFTFFAFMDELRDVGKGNYGLAQAGQYVLLTIPRMITQMFPIAVLIGCMAGLGMLARQNELTVIRAAGVSLGRIVWSVMKIGLVMIILITILGEWIAPRSEHEAQVLRKVSMSESIAFKGASGLWARDVDAFVNIREIRPDGTLSDITLYEFSDARHLRQTSHAQTAVFAKDHWQLQNVTRNQFDGGRVVPSRSDAEVWHTQLSPDLLSVVIVQPDAMSVMGLHRYVEYLKENGLQAERYQIAYWSKVAAPFISGVMIFLAIPFVFGSLRSVSGAQRIVVGTLIGVAFYLLGQVTTYVTLVFELNPMVGALLPPVLFGVFAAHSIRRIY